MYVVVVEDTINFGWTLRQSKASELTLFLWHMPADTTESLKLWPNTAQDCKMYIKRWMY